MTEEDRRAEDAALDAQFIADHREVEEFLKQPAIERVLRKVEQECFESFVKAKTEEDRFNAWARSQGMQMFLASLKGLKTNAAMAQKAIEQRALEDARRQQRNPRRG